MWLITNTVLMSSRLAQIRKCGGYVALIRDMSGLQQLLQGLLGVLDVLIAQEIKLTVLTT